MQPGPEEDERKSRSEMKADDGDEDEDDDDGEQHANRKSGIYSSVRQVINHCLPLGYRFGQSRCGSGTDLSFYFQSFTAVSL